MSGLTIGLTAYTVNPTMVFVRVPTERGRYVLTDRCVVEVDCPVCGAVTGEIAIDIDVSVEARSP